MLSAWIDAVLVRRSRINIQFEKFFLFITGTNRILLNVILLAELFPSSILTLRAVYTMQTYVAEIGEIVRAQRRDDEEIEALEKRISWVEFIPLCFD